MTDQDYPGLSTIEAEKRLEKFGLNDVEERKSGLVKKFLAPLYSPISLMLLGAAFLSYINGKIFDFYFIIALYFVNYSIQKWQEFKADKAIKELQDKLSFDVWTWRDGKWDYVNAKRLVPGDRIRLGLGSIIPADGTVLSAKNLSVNEAVLTGESLPKDKKTGDKIFSGSFIAAGNFEAEITATGKDTNFGKTIFSIEQSTEKSILEKDILNITRFLTIVSIVSVIILSVVFFLRGFSIADLLTLDLSLIIAGIPIALPAVMAIILSIGAGGLAKKQVVVRRLSALQDLANVNLLLTDKTGTLTKNEISVVSVVCYQPNLSTDDVIELASYAASNDIPDAIDSAVVKKFKETGRQPAKIEIIHYTPYDSDRKRSTAFIKKGEEKILISLGAPQVIMAFDEFGSKETAEKFEKDIQDAANEGYRVLAVAVKNGGGDEEKHMRIAGLLLLADPLDETSKEAMRFMRDNGIGVKMLTGDNKVIAERIANELEFSGTILAAAEARKLYENKKTFQKKLNDISVFAEILPKDKYEIAKAFEKKYVVAVTGDGINDLPALKVADVGIAVSGAVSALKSLADIVLLGQGLSVIKDAILESRKIFVRLYNYTVYRISESFRLIITILILGLWIGAYPLQPLQLILLAFLNDIPIISLAFDRVKISAKPSEINNKERLVSSLLFGLVGVLNSMLMFFLMANIFHLSLPVIQTMFFLKLTVSGHALIFVAHTKERWFKFLPAKQVIIATLATQAIATTLAITGFMMPAGINPLYAFFVWCWALFWMQIGELTKDLQTKYVKIIKNGTR
ncbi:MAG: plasma-membrane proton-efflux P-type ATPase [Patescibacteria group bacterium]|nr:plasma-membrane proton-efflux P-type ATPase [Patescibacteria group bacterium]